ncbi:MAG: lipopolysaccharide kinase InaA family protein [Weeksellaceae bacterium]|jgi:tRNA A-37 threonylcarbamoyl transferase component Bud32|nr:lipopolysaccharide kinase InaA family protein [Weeksellaceae bacterium]
MIFEVNPAFKPRQQEIQTVFQQFENSGTDFIVGERNHIKLFEIGGQTINVKSFKIPNKLNQFVYKYFRKSKARRSFEFANILLEKGIGTPTPVAFQENYNAFGFQKSYYASIHQEYHLTYRELVEIPNYPDHENILRQFTRFCYRMHEAGIEFKDHSPGNTLIKRESEVLYDFFLVDLNRMKFHDSMNARLRMKNLSRLTPKKDMVRIMADEYAQISGENPENLFQLLWDYTEKFQKKYHRKQKIKKKIKSLF